jgi:hypothetical protein
MHEKWLDRQLHFGKKWEIRARDTKVRAKIYLARKNLIFGETRIVDSFSVSKAVLATQKTRSAHQIADLSIVTYKTPFAWQLAETRIYSRPITFTRKKGQMIWCRVDMDRLNAHTDTIEEVEDEDDAGEMPSLVPSGDGESVKVISKGTETVIVDRNVDVLQRVEDAQWGALKDSPKFMCCTKKVGGTAVLCDVCDGAWHCYCLLHVYNVNKGEVERIQKNGEAFVCYDCVREKLGKIKSRCKPSQKKKSKKHKKQKRSNSKKSKSKK